MFKTRKRGWGICCLDDIPKGQFICVYTGNIFDEELANLVGKIYGDEYFAELDLIEVVENQKLGYESNAEDVEQLSSVSTSSNSSKMSGNTGASIIIN